MDFKQYCEELGLVDENDMVKGDIGFFLMFGYSKPKGPKKLKQQPRTYKLPKHV